MQKIKTFFRTFIKSATSPAYYAEILRAKFSFSFKYFAFAHFLAGVVITVVAMLALAKVNFSALADQALSSYPQDLVVKVASGKVTINKPLPYAIALPASWQMSRSTNQQLKNIIVFDTNSNVKGIADFYRYQTAVLVTENSIYALSGSQNREVRAYPIDQNIKPLTISAQEIQKGKSWFFNLPAMKYKLYVALAGVFVLCFLTPVLLFWSLCTAILNGMIMFVVSIFFRDVFFRHHKFTYAQVLQVSLHTLIPLLLLQIILSRLDIAIFQGGLFFIAYMLATGVALWGAGEETAVRTVKTAAKKRK